MDKKALQIKIESELSRLRSEISELEIVTKPISPENAIGRISRMDAINNKSVNEAALRTKKVELLKLENAITKIDDPQFGICVRCGNPIPEGRIMLMPGATRCVSCLK